MPGTYRGRRARGHNATMEELVRGGEENYWATMAALASAISGEEVVREDGLLLASCRSPIAFFNSAFLVPGGARSTAARVRRAVDFFGDQGVPFVVRARREVAADLPGVASSSGLVEAGVLPLMGLPAIGTTPEPPAGLEVRTVDGGDALDHHAAVVASAFGMGLELARHLFTPALLHTDGLQMFVGYVGGDAVATSLVAVTGETAGVYNVATDHGWRRRGLGEALTWWAVAAGARAGATRATLQASEMGRPVYERMGFHVVAEYLQYTSD